ncbi:MAG: hypothetical protein SFV54_18900 [Bryobacteraceae bacterium]|nr:hypothetical protein [Bryobacteraceae bacterium]
MALKFYDPANADYKCYSGYSSVAWNDASVIGGVGAVPSASKANTEAGILETVTCMASKFMLMDTKITVQSGGEGGKATDLLNLITANDYSAVVVKGIHQASNPHLTIGFATQLYHLYVEGGRAGDREKFKVTSVSVGDTMKSDAEWTLVKKKGS